MKRGDRINKRKPILSNVKCTHNIPTNNRTNSNKQKSAFSISAQSTEHTVHSNGDRVGNKRVRVHTFIAVDSPTSAPHKHTHTDTQSEREREAYTRGMCVGRIELNHRTLSTCVPWHHHHHRLLPSFLFCVSPLCFSTYTQTQSTFPLTFFPFSFTLEISFSDSCCFVARFDTMPYLFRWLGDNIDMKLSRLLFTVWCSVLVEHLTELDVQSINVPHQSKSNQIKSNREINHILHYRTRNTRTTS